VARDPGWLVAEVSVETPAGTSPSAPQSTSILTGWLYINTVRYRFPPGPMGCLGWYLTTGGNQIIPWPPSQPWIIGNDEEVTLDYAGAAGSGLTLVTANVGNYNHQILLTIEYYDIATVQAGTVPQNSTVLLNADELLDSAENLPSGIEELFQVNE
jgi:hypothetical protein